MDLGAEGAEEQATKRIQARQRGRMSRRKAAEAKAGKLTAEEVSRGSQLQSLSRIPTAAVSEHVFGRAEEVLISPAEPKR